MMTHRDRLLAVLNYQSVDRLPIVHFGYWHETLQKWASEGHITKDQAENWDDGNPVDEEIGNKLGFDFNYYRCFAANFDIMPCFERKVIETLPDGTRKVLNSHGVVIIEKDDAGSIPAEVEHTLKGRKEWDELFKPRLKFSDDRYLNSLVNADGKLIKFTEGGLDWLKSGKRDLPMGLFCGSLYGLIRNWLGLEGACYLYADDEKLFAEITETVGDLSYQCVKAVLETGAKFDFAHFWEDICFKNGPLITPSVFDEFVGPQYRRITELLKKYGITIVSLDCDGLIDSLLPTWITSGVNTMFPIEVGTWNASIKPWREKFGKEIRGVGGMNKVVFTRGRKAVDDEIERLKPLVDLGGYIPCPDHRIAPDSNWDNVRYYCDRMHKTFGG
jgi:uroporphyrinogen decarboxylase